MNARSGLENLLNWLLNRSVEAVLLVLLVLLVQWIFRRQLTGRWRFALWWIVLARLLLPFSPESPMSLFGVFRPAVRLEGPRYPASAQPIALGKMDSAPGVPPAVSPALKELAQPERGAATAPGILARDFREPVQPAPAGSGPALKDTVIRPRSLSFDDYVIPGLAGLWLAGVLVLMGVVAVQLIRFNRKLARARRSAEPRLRALFGDCQREFGISRPIELLEADAVRSPALFGLLRPRLLLPRGIGGQFADRELRCIFLHELAHVKRGDLWLNWLLTVLQIMHWFNPLLWFGFARLRSDRELACDELALLRAGDQAGTVYGETVVKLLENLNRPAAIPGLVGILEDKKQMRRRISMIAAFRRPGRWSALGALLIGAVAAVALTDPRPDDSRQSSLPVASGQPDHLREWIVSGRVLDSETKQAIQRFRGASGETDAVNRSARSKLLAFKGTNGAYLTYVSRDLARPMILVEAEGYLPEAKELPRHDATNVDFMLRQGAGPGGTVITLAGKPAAGATIILLDDSYSQAEFDSAGKLTVHGDDAVSSTADKNGGFAFEPVWGMKSLVAAGSDGLAFVGLESLTPNSIVRLEPFGKITGILWRTSGPGTNEQLELLYSNSMKPSARWINLSNHTTTDSQGRFAFDRVPPGHLRICCRELPGDAPSQSDQPLRDADLRPGETLEVIISTADRIWTRERAMSCAPQPKPIPGVEVKGIVLSPNGQRVADAQVALWVRGSYLHLGKGMFAPSGLPGDGLVVSAGRDGSFILPMDEGAQSVVALNEDGFAIVSLEELKESGQIALRRWGRIEGRLGAGRRAGTKEHVRIQPAMAGGPIGGLIHDLEAFGVKPDEQGRFAIAFVPAGRYILSRIFLSDENHWSVSHLAAVDVRAGETTVTNVGGTGRTVIGKVKTAERAALDSRNAGAPIITTLSFKDLEKGSQLKDRAEQAAYFQSAEHRSAIADQRIFSAHVSADGSFRVDDVLPGMYELQWHSTPMLISAREFLVPETGDKGDDSPVDWGEVELRKVNFPTP